MSARPVTACPGTGGDGDQKHRGPVAEEERDDDYELLPNRSSQREQRSEDVTDADMLQHSRESYTRDALEREEWKSVEQDAKGDDQRPAQENRTRT